MEILCSKNLGGESAQDSVSDVKVLKENFFLLGREAS
jgi:hypothetical protein